MSAIGKIKDITGQIINEWTVIKEAGRNKSGGVMFLCRCSCGAERVVEGRSIRAGTSKNCGHNRIEKLREAGRKGAIKHGGRNERLYAVWQGMKSRCYNPKSRFYQRYGGRGIIMCPEWKDDYNEFRIWALNNGYDQNSSRGMCTIERLDNNSGYSPDNCVWATSKTQCNNRSSNHIIEAYGESHTLTEWAEKIGVRKDTLRRRICVYGWTPERAVTEPTHR